MLKTNIFLIFFPSSVIIIIIIIIINHVIFACYKISATHIVVKLITSQYEQTPTMFTAVTVKFLRLTAQLYNPLAVKTNLRFQRNLFFTVT
jgi:hypothetical protein